MRHDQFNKIQPDDILITIDAVNNSAYEAKIPNNASKARNKKIEKIGIFRLLNTFGNKCIGKIAHMNGSKVIFNFMTIFYVVFYSTILGLRFYDFNAHGFFVNVYGYLNKFY